MLSREKDIKNPKELCKFIVGRTGSGPIDRCNKALASYRQDVDYSVVLSYKKNSMGLGPGVLSVTAKQKSTARSFSTRNLNFPLSIHDFVEAITQCDEIAEHSLQLGYGQQAGGSAESPRERPPRFN